MSIIVLNALQPQAAHLAFMQCCTANTWVNRMVAAVPYNNLAALSAHADVSWKNLTEADYLQAFEGHPKIGDVSSLREKYRSTEKIAAGEQSGVNTATEQALSELKRLNDDYQEKFGFIFIVCATGKTATQMLDILVKRYANNRAEEIINAAEEQRKILQLRIEKMIAETATTASNVKET
ncbi:OHCU decarboxylase [Colwellia sp. PAMC 20917]|uniref:2-oxo-4-hydroxy-4-carboxy-5-ureidoimidazoline decarboxylase n=1 Tax=Colwellia sp. PAMC 20917 TaxID=1816218 RepID=UPI0008784242|nr:2-oxo-4-hydroxy-4-carboxy-5-ureidoimidazoline decarboxylase [Colwellia sp. PAMC 20917]AOW78775.1 OHCU decarboxylase [Colwellia sp. PAMC 20917]